MAGEGEETEGGGEGRQKEEEEEKERRASVSGRGIYRSAARVKEAWKSVSRERTRGERGWPDHGNPRRVLLSAEQRNTVGIAFSRSLPPR